MMSYADMLRKPAPLKETVKHPILDVLNNMPDVEFVKYIAGGMRENVIPVRYKGSSFDFIKDSDGHWELRYNLLVHKKIKISGLSAEKMAEYFDDVLLCWDRYEYGY